MLNISYPRRLLKASCEHFLFFFLLKLQSSLVALSYDFAFREFEDVLWDPTHKTHGEKPSKTQAVADCKKNTKSYFGRVLSWKLLTSKEDVWYAPQVLI